MKREDDRQLWDLLGQAAEPTLSPFFARNVVRQIRQTPSWTAKLGLWLRPQRLIPATAVAFVLFGTALVWQRPAATQQKVDSLEDSIAQLDPIDFDVVADLDDLLASEEDNLWTDDDISTL